MHNRLCAVGRGVALFLALVLVFLSACSVVPAPTELPEPAPAVADDDDALTRAYVMAAIERYDREGRDATVAYYSGLESMQGERFMLIMDPATTTALAWIQYPSNVGPQGPTSEVIARLFKRIAAAATPEGSWIEYQNLNPLNSRTEPSRNLVVLHDGLVFSAGHFGILEKYEQGAKNYVAAAIERYDKEGLDAVITRYNSRESMDGQYYLFLIGADDIYLAHPIFPHLIGTDIKDVVGSNGYELGKEIAKATEEGHWVGYLWPNPVTNREEAKSTFVLRHDGLIFATGFYTADDDAEPPAWLGADPREYTVTYVRQAIERYTNDGLEAFKAYYNSVSAFQGEWYLFVTDASDIYIVHPLLPNLIGTDIKDVVGANGYELGKEIARATEEGHWIDYLWPHPVTLWNAPKSSFAVRHDGMIFASGFYPVPEDVAAQTKAFVHAAIDLYDKEGREAMVAYYSDPANSDGVRFLQLIDENGIFAPPTEGGLAGVPAAALNFPDFAGEEVGPQFLTATEEGIWLHFPYPGLFGSQNYVAHTWLVRHDGLIFMSAYFDVEPSVPESEQ